MTGQQIDRDRLRTLADEYDDSTIDGGPNMAAGAIRQLLDMLGQAEQRIRDLTQEARDERAACLDQMEQVQSRDARIKAVRDIHTPEKHSSRDGDAAICQECLYGDGYSVKYPCPTIRALDGER